MAINLPQPGNIFIPEVPDSVRKVSPELFDWAQKTRRVLQDGLKGAFANSFHISTAINSGTSGTFTISSGGSIIVTSGIVINVTS